MLRGVIVGMKDQRITKPLRFALDRTCGRSYVHQLTEAIRDAIESGYYHDGDILPTLEDMATSAGVSIIVPREAISRLADAGMVVPRRGVGCVVRAPKAGSMGHVLLLTSERVDNRYNASICATLRDALVRAGYRVSHCPVLGCIGGKPDFSQLDLLLGSSVSLVVSLIAKDGVVERRVARAGVPIVVVDTVKMTGKNARNVVGRLPQNRFSALPEFVAHCVRAGVRHVTEITADFSVPVALDALRKAGVSADEWHFPVVRRFAGENCVEPQVFAAMRECCCRRRDCLHDLIFISDDIVARSVLTAFMAEGICVPKDVQVAIWCIQGFEPLSAVPLTRLETDTSAVGRAYAEYILGILSGNRDATCPVVGNRYIIGGSFP